VLFVGKKMRKVIFTISVNGGICFDICTESQRRYAKRIGVDFVCRHSFHSDIKELGIDRDKYFVAELLKIYDKVLYLDADVFIKKDALDIFRFYENNNNFIVYNEVMYNGVQMDDAISKAMKENKIDEWQKTNGHYDWLNAGVMLFSQGHEKIMEYMADEFFKLDEYPLLYDMPYMIYKIHKYNIPVTYMDKRFNTMIYFEDNGDFLHFANVHDRDERILKYKEM